MFASSCQASAHFLKGFIVVIDQMAQEAGLSDSGELSESLPIPPLIY